MDLIHFPKAQIDHKSTGNRNLYINPLNVDFVMEDSDKVGLTAVISQGVWQWVEMSIAQVIKALSVAKIFHAETGKEEPVELPVALKEIKKS